MQLHEIFFNSADKQVSIDQSEYRSKKEHFLKNRLPFTVSAKKDGIAVNLSVTVAREDNTIIVHLIDDDQIAGRLYLAKPDIFPGAYYVSSMALATPYQGYGIGPALYDALMQHLGISFVGVDQSLGARKMWVRLSRIRSNALYAVMPTRQNGNVFFIAIGDGDSDYVYVNYDGTKKPVADGGNLYVILTKRSGKMTTYIKQHMKLTAMRHQLSKVRAHADPFSAHIVS